jgi:hypothetical protein
MLPDAIPTFLAHGHEDVEGGLWALLRLAPLVLLPLAIHRALQLDHPRWPLLSYDDLLAFGQLGLRRPNEDLPPIELDHVHVYQEWVIVELHLGTFCKF